MNFPDSFISPPIDPDELPVDVFATLDAREAVTRNQREENSREIAAAEIRRAAARRPAQPIASQSFTTQQQITKLLETELRKHTKDVTTASTLAASMMAHGFIDPSGEPIFPVAIPIEQSVEPGRDLERFMATVPQWLVLDKAAHALLATPAEMRRRLPLYEAAKLEREEAWQAEQAARARHHERVRVMEQRKQAVDAHPQSAALYAFAARLLADDGLRLRCTMPVVLVRALADALMSPTEIPTEFFDRAGVPALPEEN